MTSRIQSLINQEGISASKFADILGVQPSAISHILSGRNKPGYDLLVKILQEFPAISPDWLILGQGQMYRDGKVAKNQSLFPNNEEAIRTRDLAVNDDTSIKMPQSEDNECDKRSDVVDNDLRGDDYTRKKHIVKVLILYSDNSVEIFHHKP